ncbi:MAG: TerB family tellurite resistance protein [Proteobacteria bacterium]|nr:TerB family tellurite resistance protein [Pseudomonadota bacterium]
MNLWKIFGIEKKERSEDPELGELFGGMEAILQDFAENDIKYVTGFAGLLGKVAYADMEMSDDEVAKMQSILSSTLRLRDSQVGLIVKMLQNHSVQLCSLEDYRYVRMINKVCDKEQKMELIEAMFAVASADESVSSEEDSAIYVVSKGIGLSHKDFVTVRAQFKNYLEVLKG